MEETLRAERHSGPLTDNAIAAVLTNRKQMARISDWYRKRPQRGLAISIMGYDGSGKTTLAHQLLAVFDAAEIPARRLHVYQWYRNILQTPIILLLNRYRWKTVLVWERGIYDNVANLCAGRLRCLLPGLLGLVRALYPSFDFKFHPCATLERTLARRADTHPEQYLEMTSVYAYIAKRVGYAVMDSDETLLHNVLERLAPTAWPSRD